VAIQYGHIDYQNGEQETRLLIGSSEANYNHLYREEALSDNKIKMIMFVIPQIFAYLDKIYDNFRC
jgi:hypothetical protein